MMKRLTGFVMLAVLGLPLATWAFEIQVTVTGLRNAEGNINIALFDTANHFPKDGKAITRARVTARMDTVHARLSDLSAGTYAIAVYHDENGNGKLDRNLLGVPTEGYGFSNDARGRMGPPSFDQAAFTLGEADQVMTIAVNY